MSTIETTKTRQLAEPIRTEHECVRRALTTALTHAREAGRLLSEARTQIQHGGWIAFVEQECGLSRSTAAGYVRIYERWTELQPYVERVAHLPFRQALKILAEPRSTSVSIDTEVNDENADQQRVVALKATLNRGDVTVAELQAVIDKATAIMARATARRVEAEEEYARLIPPNVCLYSERLKDGFKQWAYLHPFTDPAYVFYNVMTDAPDGGGTLDGGRRPIRRERAWTALQNLGFPVATTDWNIKPCREPWTYNEWMYDSHEDYVQQTLLGKNGYVDSPYLANLPEEHAAFMQRVRGAQ